MSNKMLIDASHPEETRVAVVRGNRIEEFDFESQEKKQLRGNIYLAKVTRVEPSLQAAFIDYGGNRHGFLAFSEIHPDYYQIPVADRQALLEAEAAEARAQREAEEAEDDAAPDLDLEAEADDENADEDEVEAKPRQRRSRTRRGRKTADNDSSNEDGDGETSEAKDGDNQTEQAVIPADEIVKAGATAEVATNADAEKDAPQEGAKPMRRSTRRKPAAANKATDKTAATADETTAEKIATEASGTEAGEKPAKPRAPRRTTSRVRKKADNESEAGADQHAATSQTDAADDLAETADENSNKPSRTMSAMIETEAVSEPLPGEDDSSDDGPSLDQKSDVGETTEQPLDTAGETGAEAGAETKPEKDKPKRARKPRKKAAEKADSETNADEAERIEAESADASANDGEKPSEGAEKPKRKPRRTRKAKVTEETDGQSEGEESGTDDNLSSETASEETGDTETVRAEKPSRTKSRRGRKKSEPEGDFEDHDESVVETVGSDDEIDAVAPPTRFRKQYKIQEVIKRRQVMLIQVVKEERGNKGAALTTYLSLAGRYSVLMPNTARGGGISRKITNSVDRKKLKAIANELDVPKGMGVILRTAGASRTKDEVERDFQYLMRLWEQVRNLTLASSAPCLVYEEGSLIKRSIRDLYNKETSEILVAGEEGYREARDFMEMLLPDQVDRVKQYSGSQTIFARYGVETQLDAMVTPQVTLKSGGYLVINQTEALVAVDVNSGRATREHSVEKTALQTNLEAAEEVARQLRLRDLAGLIVIDFIDMEERRNNRAVEKKLKDCLKNDRARIQVGRISHFGLMEMSRQRIRASVLDSTMNVCPHCAGVGHVRSESAIALHVFRALEEHVTRNRGRNVVVQTTPKIADHMLNHKRAALVDLESQYGIRVVISGNSAMTGQEFHIEKGDKVHQNDDDVAVIGIDTDNAAEAGTGEVTDNRHRRNAHTGDDAQKGERKFPGRDNDTPEDEDDPDKPRKKRRRRKRGGRKNRDGAEETTALPMGGDGDGEAGILSEAAGDLPDTVASGDAKDGSTQATKAMRPAADAATSSSEPDEAEALSDDDAAKKTRSTRRKKAPVAAPVEAAVSDGDGDAVAKASAEANGVDNDGESMTASAPARPKRRTTRRKRADQADTSEVSGESSSVIEDVPVEPEMRDANGSEDTSETLKQPTVDTADTAETTSSEGDTGEAGAKPKRSWWSRGTGFF